MYLLSIARIFEVLSIDGQLEDKKKVWMVNFVFVLR